MANSAALLFTVFLLMVTAYFFFGSVPLLILKHDNPVDAKFIRSFYSTYYRMALFVAVGATISYFLSNRLFLSLEAATIAVVTLYLWRKFIPQMDHLGSRIQANDPSAVQAFRKIHKSAIAINLFQLVVITGGLGSL